ncbi:hypothetical protein IAR55_004989 [Kwoniella newhampshirensis]|uniref:UPF3 domain-containing protein n=1 Tax=Kwoniella newhampshirensis TaxID=1651941 RepID=A0AAW0YX59_9TREE
MATSSSSTAAARNKLVIRRLPPTLPEDIFWRSVSAWITDETCLWKRYVKGKTSDGSYGSHSVHSRAYVLMANPEALVNFHRGFDGHVFKSKTGAEFQAVVEYAPVQKTPYKAKVKADARQATIDEDPDYLSYIESLNAPPTKPVLEVSVPQPQPTITPLIEYLRAHAKSGSKGKGKGASKSAQSSSIATESARRTAALASVQAAASKRTTQANTGPIMVAGKGREVVIATASGPSVPEPGQAGGDKGKRGGRGKKKGAKDKEKDNSNDKDQTPTGHSVGGQQKPQAGKATSQANSSGQRGSKPSLSGGQTQRTQSPAGGKTDGVGPAGRGSGKGAAGGVAGGGSGGRGRGGGAGRGRGGGGDSGGGKDRSGRGQVMEILARNVDGEGATKGGRGGRRGGGRGGGGGGGTEISDVGAATARIDV